MKIGFLPLYIKLYDEVVPGRRPIMQANADRIAGLFNAKGFEVIQAPICRVKSEFTDAVRMFEDQGAEVILTLHLAYSPSLESIDAIAGSSLPVVILDTTADYEFGFEFGDKLMANHGIHGVQDFCNLLIRRGKKFLLAAGHWEKSNVIDRASDMLRSASMAYGMTHARIGAVGGSFAGMGDFAVPEGTFGMKVIPYCPQPEPSEADIQAEIERDRNTFVIGKCSGEAHRNSVSAGLKIRHWVEQEKLSSFTVCFLGITRAEGWNTVPFLEASKSMARGIGYAGEGDILTAALVASLMKVFPQTGFSEMFCPDWAGNRIFVSHMGECNLALADCTPLLAERAYSFSDTGNPALATCSFKAGKALWVNLAPGPDGKFTLIAAPVEFVSPGKDSEASNTGWFIPGKYTVAAFLEAFSKLGGTHHSAVCYNASPDRIREFAELMGWDFQLLA